MINFLYSHKPKNAVLANIALRTKWITTVENLLGCLELTDAIDNPVTLKGRAAFSAEPNY